MAKSKKYFCCWINHSYSWINYIETYPPSDPYEMNNNDGKSTWMKLRNDSINVGGDGQVVLRRGTSISDLIQVVSPSSSTLFFRLNPSRFPAWSKLHFRLETSWLGSSRYATSIKSRNDPKFCWSLNRKSWFLNSGYLSLKYRSLIHEYRIFVSSNPDFFYVTHSFFILNMLFLYSSSWALFMML